MARDFQPPAADPGGPAQLRELARSLGCRDPLDLARPDLGNEVVTSASSWVRRVEAASGTFFVKTYVYRSVCDRWRGVWRNTGPWRASRAAREAEALRWLAAHGMQVPAVAGVVEQRRFGFVATAVLVTEAWPGERLDALLDRLPAADCRQLAADLGRFVAQLHRLGFRDGNLDLRNLLAQRAGDGFRLTKIDSPRFAVVPSGAHDDRRSRADWARLLPQLQVRGLAAEALAAAAAVR